MERGCRNCMWLYHMVTHNPTAPCSECLDYNKWQTTKQTNYDRLVKKSPKELAGWLAYSSVPKEVRNGMNNGAFETQADAYLWWLKQEAKE